MTYSRAATWRGHMDRSVSKKKKILRCGLFQQDVCWLKGTFDWKTACCIIFLKSTRSCSITVGFGFVGVFCLGFGLVFFSSVACFTKKVWQNTFYNFSSIVWNSKKERNHDIDDGEEILNKFWHQKICDFTKSSKPDTPKYLQTDLLNTLKFEPVPWKWKDPFQFRVAKSIIQTCTDREVKIPNCKRH